MNTVPNIKKCPFCGSTAELMILKPQFYGKCAAFVKCTNKRCRAEGPQCNIAELHFIDHGISTPITPESEEKGAKEAVEKWNKRTA